jgi:HlyD family secretion protein
MQTKISVELTSSYMAVPGESVKVTIGEKSVDGIVYSMENGMMTVQFDDSKFTVGDTATVTSESGVDLGAGDIEIANPVYITAHGGVIEDIREPAGHKVKVRTKLFKLEGDILSADLYSQIQQRKDLEQDLADIEEDIAGLTVYAGTDGVVSNLALNKEQIVQPGTPLFNVQSNNAIKLDVEIDEIDIVNIELGQEATVEFDALPDKTYTASVIKINPVGVSTNNVTNFTITLQIEQAKEIMLGMSADVKIVSQSAKGVLLIPIEAIQVINGEKYVVFEEDIDEEQSYTVATHKIETGITDGVMIEVTQGLVEGDRVAVPQARELTPQEMQQSMFGGSRNSDSDDN